MEGSILALVAAFLLSTFAGSAGADEVCAARFSELGATRALEPFKALFNENQRLELLNETGGSFVRVEDRDGQLWLSFFSTGFFDLIPIRKQGPLKVCDSGGDLFVEALGRREKLVIQQQTLIVGEGGPKQRFAPGEMTPLLLRVHHYFWR